MSTKEQTDKVDESWAEKMMATINRLTPDVKGKAFSPDWFLLRQCLEEKERELAAMTENAILKDQAIERHLAAQSATLALKDDVPLKCEVVDGAIQFVIGAKVLAHATNICPTLYDAERDHGRYRVTAPVTFAKAVADELNHEDEAGETLLTRMLDEAIDDAINQGAEGVEENNDERQPYVGQRSPEGKA
jgi:hypothetical protein